MRRGVFLSSYIIEYNQTQSNTIKHNIMSSCRNTYCNYGSYLRSRGVDSQICALNTLINNNNLTDGGIINGDLTITGTLTVGTSSSVITSSLVNATNIQVNDVATISGELLASNIKSSNSATTDDIIIDCSMLDISNAVIYRNIDLDRQSNVFAETVSIIRLQDITSLSVTNTPTTIFCNVFDTNPSNYILYSNARNPTQIFKPNQPTNNNIIIDVSSNQPYFRDCIVEIYITCKVTLGIENKTLDYTLFTFESTQTPSIQFIVDTRSFGKRTSAVNVTYGPYTFLTTSNFYSILGETYKIKYEAKLIDSDSNSLTVNMEDIRVTFKQKFIN